jgi:hypothetical protein
MKLSTVMRWGAPVAIVSGVFTMFSDLLGLTIYVPGLGEAANTGYEAVGAGVILFALMLLVIGMVGLYAQPKPGGPRVLEYGDASARYVLTELVDGEDLPEPVGARAETRDPRWELPTPHGVPVAAARRHRAGARG